MLFANNQHPLQLACYQEYNQFLKTMHSLKHVQAAEDFSARFDEVATQRASLLNAQEGETLSIEDLTEVYIQVKGEQRESNKMSLNTMTKTGDIADHLETRRPWGTPAAAQE